MVAWANHLVRRKANLGETDLAAKEALASQMVEILLAAARHSKCPGRAAEAFLVHLRTLAFLGLRPVEAFPVQLAAIQADLRTQTPRSPHPPATMVEPGPPRRPLEAAVRGRRAVMPLAHRTAAHLVQMVQATMAGPLRGLEAILVNKASTDRVAHRHQALPTEDRVGKATQTCFGSCATRASHPRMASRWP